MIPAIPPISAQTPTVAAPNAIAPTLTAGAPAAGAVPPNSFGNMLAQAVDALQSVQQTSNQLATGVASGTANIGDAMVAASQASLDTQVAVSLRNGVVGAINQLMATQF